MTDTRIQNFARILVDYSLKVQPGDRVAIVETTTDAIPAIQALYALLLDRGAHPHVLMEFPDQYEILLRHGNDEQLEFTDLLKKQIYADFDVLIKLRSLQNTRRFGAIDPARQSLWQSSQAELLKQQVERGAAGSLRWMSTIFPTEAYAMEADMGLQAFQDFFFHACHADENTADPVAYWESVYAEQEKIARTIEGHDRVSVRSPNADLQLSVKGRIFKNAAGQNNLPDGEIYTGPVETSVNGWVKFTYPAVYQGRVVEGVELTFAEGKVVKATATKNEDFLLRMLDVDPGARYLGEFAIGNNYDIDRFTRNILFDEKIGGSFHLALGASYPDTGGQNQSKIHWDMICDISQDSEITVDGEPVYRNGKFLI